MSGPELHVPSPGPRVAAAHRSETLNANKAAEPAVGEAWPIAPATTNPSSRWPW